MKLLPIEADRAGVSVCISAALALALTSAGVAWTQSPQSESKSAPTTIETVRLTHATAQRDLNDLQTALRNMMPTAVTYTNQTQNSISIRGTSEEIDAAKKLIAELDQPKRSYRITYTFTEIDNGKPAGVHHLTLLVVSGDKSIAKHGNRVPIVTGMFDKENTAQSSQVQYLDVGLNVEASLDGDRLRSKLEQSAVADEKSGIGVQDPVVRQTMIEATTDLKPGKSSLLGSLDIPGTSRRQDVEVVAERIQ